MMIAKTFSATAIAMTLFVVLGAFGCATTKVDFEIDDPSISLETRPSGCHVDVFELGREAKHNSEFKIVGTLIWELNKTQMRQLSPQQIEQRLHRAACKHGLFVISEVTAYPNTGYGGARYEAKGGVLLDNNGEILNRATDKK